MAAPQSKPGSFAAASCSLALRQTGRVISPVRFAVFFDRQPLSKLALYEALIFCLGNPENPISTKVVIAKMNANTERERWMTVPQIVEDVASQPRLMRQFILTLAKAECVRLVVREQRRRCACRIWVSSWRLVHDGIPPDRVVSGTGHG